MPEDKKEPLGVEARVSGFLEKVRREAPLNLHLWEAFMDAFVLKNTNQDDHLSSLTVQKKKLDEILRANAEPMNVISQQAQQIADLKAMVEKLMAAQKTQA